MKYHSLLLSGLIAFLTTSCSVIFKMKQSDSIVKKVKVLENDTKRVVFLPVSHVGKKSYYESIKTMIDSLRNDNYTVYFESVSYQTELSEAKKDTIARKMRRILGWSLTSSYKDSTNKSMPKYIRNNDYVDQTAQNTGLKTGDKLVDIPQNRLIELYEQDYGTIQLNECDFNTPLNEKFKCKELQKHATRSFLITYRNKHLVRTIQTDENNKIVIMYGSGHWYDFSRRMYQEGYKLTQGTKA
ncbi:hypothetical protein ABN763_02530 [Spongiivirga sp. MCCC 1A20706]|uniref:hypothetical protein n=1 Tax=Spongiivirga sp. MCCC 1A20706 TaxID=3160963 RepID=UPI003977A398